MEWIEIKLQTTSEGIDNTCAMLMSLGINGFQIEDNEDMKNFFEQTKNDWDYIEESLINKNSDNCYITFYISKDKNMNENIMSIQNGIQRLKKLEMEIDFGSLNITSVDVDDKDWLDNWKKYYKPFEIGRCIVIKPSWEVYENKEKVVFNINPGHLFGTGLHATTQLCILRLEKYIFKDSIVLDLGCGTGILSIISLLLGAKQAVAVDVDVNAEQVAYENALLNDVSKQNYKVLCGDVLNDQKLANDVLASKYDVIVCNIIADVIISLATFISKCINTDGIIIASGIIKDKLDDVYEQFKLQNFEVIDTFFDGEWVCIVSKYVGRV